MCKTSYQFHHESANILNYHVFVLQLSKNNVINEANNDLVKVKHLRSDVVDCRVVVEHAFDEC